MPDLFRTPESDEPEAVSRTCEKVQWKNAGKKRKDREIWSDCYFVQVRQPLTESSKSPVSIAKSNKQWVGTCLYQEECKLLLINCGAVIRL